MHGLLQLPGQRRAGGIHQPALRIGQHAIGIALELLHAALEKVRIGVVVALGDPDTLALRQLEPLVPLPEGRPAVRLVIDDMGDVRLAAISLDHLARIVGRTIVENNHLEIPVGLVQHAVDPHPQIGGVAIIGNDDRCFHDPWEDSGVLFLQR